MTGPISTYYDDFLRKRMVGYRIDGNPRLDAAARLVETLVKNGSVVADIGCGIGIIAEKLGKRFPDAKIIGVDISPDNIEYARRTICLPNVHFVTASVTEQFDQLLARASSGFDVIMLVDVIEHIPEDQRPALFTDLNRVAKADALMMLTYPSPEYQRYLMRNNPSELQFIDNIIELQRLLTETEPQGWQLKYLNHVDVWHYNQYVHAVFAKSLQSNGMPHKNANLLKRAAARVDKLMLRPYRYRKYAEKPFSSR